MRWRSALVLPLVAIAGAAPVARGEAASPIREISHAITELEVERARRLLAEMTSESPAAAFERARLAVYVGDCDSAAATLSALPQTPESAGLLDLATSCSRAVAGSVLVHDEQKGVWMRLQDDEDRALAPFIVDVAVEARAAIEEDLGVTLPRPLRLDIVRDLFSLSAVSGLPLSAAETTGTVGVARWGRVTMLSPRAAALGYPWEDTLAHEITHLVLSHATRDRAPLWLQEGLAKREEQRWRPARPFDGDPPAEAVARAALASGEAVGIDTIGPSIAMLPTPAAASVAFAEVQSFVEFWIRENGELALHLLLADLKGLDQGDADAAMRSVTGYPLAYWNERWKRHLIETEAEQPVAGTEESHLRDARPPRDLVRRVRLTDLLYGRAAYAEAAKQAEQGLRLAERLPLIRWRAGRARVAAGQPADAAKLFRSVEDVSGGHGGWYALHGYFLKRAGDTSGAEAAFRLGIALDPYREDVACEGRIRLAGSQARPELPEDPRRRGLCEAARKIPRE